ncbi:MAG TPA: flagellar basal body rod protein FlgB [Rhizomicrobium sp.]|nr:flagellar basal body rod protein FlgB [Rhizomicrobium sp.]
MDITSVPLMTMLREKMSWLNRRQDILTENVANADTPAFTARDLKPIDFAQELRNESQPSHNARQLSVTDPRHISLSKNSTQFEDYEVHDAEANPNGNSVSLEQEMIKVSDTQAQFQAATNLYAKTITMMKTAIGH